MRRSRASAESASSLPISLIDLHGYSDLLLAGWLPSVEGLMDALGSQEEYNVAGLGQLRGMTERL